MAAAIGCVRVRSVGKGELARVLDASLLAIRLTLTRRPREHRSRETLLKRSSVALLLAALILQDLHREMSAGAEAFVAQRSVLTSCLSCSCSCLFCS